MTYILVKEANNKYTDTDAVISNSNMLLRKEGHVIVSDCRVRDRLLKR